MGGEEEFFSLCFLGLCVCPEFAELDRTMGCRFFATPVGNEEVDSELFRQKCNQMMKKDDFKMYACLYDGEKQSEKLLDNLIFAPIFQKMKMPIRQNI